MKNYKEVAAEKGIQHTFDILKAIDFETAVNITTAEKYLLNELNGKLFEKLINGMYEYLCLFDAVFFQDSSLLSSDDFQVYKNFRDELTKMGVTVPLQTGIFEHFENR